MKRRSLFLLIALLIMLSVVMTGCSRDDVAVVRIQLKNVPQSAAQNQNSVFERVFRWFVPNAYAVSVPDWVSSLGSSIQVIISAPDLEDISFSIPPTETNIVLELPSGPARRITAYGFNTSASYGKNWGGHAEVNLNPGDEINAVINMLPVTQVMPEYYGGLSVNIHWSSNVVGNYGVVGYNVYRSENSNGPYEKILAGVPAAPATDSNNIVYGKKYYYKVSAITATAEGEKSDSVSITAYMN